ncbi:MAG TPA: hypothetical protein VL200_07665 [Lacunisphaera sp.]|jgi:hypothetical protein|nr:hypothetical protein [Lacunisphaera sp.]
MGLPIPVPPSIRREVAADRVIIRRIWREGGGAIAWVCIAVIWNFALYAMYRAGKFGPGEAWAYPWIPWVLLAIGIYAAYRCMAALLNTTVMEISPDLLRVATGPLPWHGVIRLAPAEIGDVVFHERVERGYASTFDVAVVLASGRERRLVRGLNRYEVAAYYVREIRSLLGRPEVAMARKAGRTKD